MTRRIDPIFGIQTPILFAHRGGAKEAPESTQAGFQHAIDSGTEVLELDVQLTRDEEMVVWHGPKLDNVRLAIDDNSRTRTNVNEYDWGELKDKAWVMHPENGETLQTVPQHPSRLLLTLEEFLAMYPNAKLTVEMKEHFTPTHLDRFIDILNNGSPDRVKVVASSRNETLLNVFREKTGGRFATNLPLYSLMKSRVSAAFGTLRNQFLYNRAFELPHPRLLAPRTMIEQVRDATGCSYIFLTHIPLVKALDAEKGSPSADALFEILDRGVDGIMTDRPSRVRQLMNEWIHFRSPSV